MITLAQDENRPQPLPWASARWSFSNPLVVLAVCRRFKYHHHHRHHHHRRHHHHDHDHHHHHHIVIIIIILLNITILHLIHQQ